MSTFDYVTLEKLLRQSLEMVQSQFTPFQVQEVLDVLEFGEYGLAFENLVSCIVEANVTLSGSLCALLKDAAHRMNYHDDLAEIRNREVKTALALVWEACASCVE